MSQGKKGTRGEVLNLTLPTPIMERIERRADACYSQRTEYLRRFIIDNIDNIDPPEREP